MWNKFKKLCHRFWHGPDIPKVSTYEDMDIPEHDLLKANGVEYRFPSLLKPPKVKFRIKPARK